MENKKWVVWDLCGGSQQSVYNAVKDFENIELYTFDIQYKICGNINTFYLDLSASFDDILEYLYNNDIPKPDFILASPPCNAFSGMVRIPKQYNTVYDIPETLGVRYYNGGYCVRDEFLINHIKRDNKFLKHYKPENVRNTANKGMSILDNIINLIDYYKPKYWYIENPRNSIMWNVIETNYKLNLNDYVRYYNNTYYSDYDAFNFSLKPITFLSNKYLELRRLKTKSFLVKANKNARMAKPGGDAGERAKIPKELITNILCLFILN